MKSLIKKMHFALYILLTAGLLSCSTEEKEPRKEQWYLYSYYDNGWSRTAMKCDSLQMISKTEAFIWVDGKKHKIVGEELRPTRY